jgi:hypothetical protein
MAVGDVTIFNKFKEDIGRSVHNLHTNTIKLGLVTSSVTPAASTSDPRWGAGGSTNLSSNEVTPGGNYSTGGPTIANTTYTVTSATATFDGDNVTILQNASNPSNAEWGIIYNDTAAGKQAIAFIELGGVDLSAGEFAVNWNASGIFTLGDPA